MRTQDMCEPPEDWAADYEEYLMYSGLGNDSHNLWATIKDREVLALGWLEKQIEVNPGELVELVEYVRLAPVFNDPVYRVVAIPKRTGRRLIHVPVPKLLRAQKIINARLLSQFKPAKVVCGFSGGTVASALQPHVSARSILRVDFQNAFPSVDREQVFRTFRSHFHWYVSNALADLTTYQGALPQGAPTSPRIFDLVCADFDRHMIKLARNADGNYTRYADNVFFSVPHERFPRALRQAIIKLIENRRPDRQQRRWGPSFKWHKLRIGGMSVAVRGLGLNIMNGQLHNTRDWKRRLRKTLHHVQYLFDHYLDYESNWAALEGMMQFACEDTLPKKLAEQFEALYDRVYRQCRPWLY